MTDMERIWWGSVPNAARYVQEIVDAIHEEKSMVLVLGENVPWRDFLPALIEERIADISDRSLRRLACPEEEPGAYLLEHYCMEETRLTYRAGKSHAQFLAEAEGLVLHKAILWIDIADAGKARAWTDFVRDYHKFAKKGAAKPSFILIFSEDYGVGRGCKGLSYHAFSEEVNEFDRFAFATLMAAYGIEQRRFKPYLAMLAATICAEDMELCALCSRYGMEFLRSPGKTLRKIAEEEVRSDGSPFVLDDLYEDLERRIWKAQVKTVFPVIEDRRQAYIERCYDALRAMNLVPEEVEIGALSHKAAIGELRFPSADVEDIRLLKEARNHLAHIREVPFPLVEAILSKGD